MGRHGSAASMSTAKVSKSASCESHLSGSVSGELTKDSTTSSMSSGSQLSLSRDEIASSLERPYDAEGPEINEVSTVLSVTLGFKSGWVCLLCRLCTTDSCDLPLVQHLLTSLAAS